MSQLFDLLYKPESNVCDGQITCIDGGFPGSDRHVGCVSHQCGPLHDALSLPIHLHGQLSVRQHPQTTDHNYGTQTRLFWAAHLWEVS